jgi:hypothetical protein
MCQEHRSSCARQDGDTERSAKSTGHFDLSTHLPNWVVGQSGEAVLGQLHWEANGGGSHNARLDALRTLADAQSRREH